MRYLGVAILLSLTICANSQEKALQIFLSDSAMIHGSVSLRIANINTQENILEYNSDKSFTPASVLKLVTSASALELLGPDYVFKTVLGYSGSLNRKTGKLSGDIIIIGGGDPALGSEYFSEHYNDFISKWIDEIKKSGIKKVTGRVITDDTYFDNNPVSGKWLIEDIGNYYGAGVYGLSVFDNTYEIHFNTTDSNHLIINKIVPNEFNISLTNNLKATGNTDEGYIYSMPYGNSALLVGTIPVNAEDFVLKGSIPDPPFLIAKIINDRLEAEGIKISGEPTTLRKENKTNTGEVVNITETISPALSEIIEVLNHESVNLYAETLARELGKKYRNNGSTSAGVEVIKDFLENAGIKTDGLFIEDGSGLSPANSINSSELVNLLLYMNLKGKNFAAYYNSLPEAGKNGTLKSYFKDGVFDSRLRAKSGSITRVRSYAGYFTTISGKNMAFSIIVNNFSGPSKHIIAGIEGIIKEVIENK
jgi:D-alanyl-D-alanine carboxypeptidase/D-alanyl-D-alanine-endopeptidase (penicillin-binding protein 4)